MKALLKFIMLGLIVLISGCVVVPTPDEVDPESRANISRQAIRPFELGKTTRCQVVLALGEPDEVSDDERRLVYRYEAVTAYLVWVVPYVTAGGESIETKQRFVAEFDEQGILTVFDTTHL